MARNLMEAVDGFLVGKHYHEEQTYQGLDNDLIDGSHQDAAGTGAVVGRERLGGLLNFYHREAA